MKKGDTRRCTPIGPRGSPAVGLHPALYDTHSLRRTKIALSDRRTGNLRAVRLLPDHTRPQHTVRYLAIAMDDALALTEQTGI